MSISLGEAALFCQIYFSPPAHDIVSNAQILQPLPMSNGHCPCQKISERKFEDRKRYLEWNLTFQCIGFMHWECDLQKGHCTLKKNVKENICQMKTIGFDQVRASLAWLKTICGMAWIYWPEFVHPLKCMFKVYCKAYTDAF